MSQDNLNWYKISLYDELLRRKSPFLNDGKNIAAFQYISPRHKPNLSPIEKLIREISYRIKDSGDSEAIAFAAKAMSRYVPSNSILVPVPSSSGSTLVNIALAEAIARLSSSQVIDPLSRREAVMPLHQRRKDKGIKGEIDPEEHKMSVKGVDALSQMSGSSVFMIDNVITSGSTIDASRKIINRPDAIGLAFSKAG